MPASTSLEPGFLFHERYRVVRCVKRGGMGAVFEVVDERTTTRRALKVMRPDIVDDEDLRGRFEREARVTGGVESDHVVRVSDAGVDAETDTPFLVMDFLHGSDLGTVLGARARCTPAEAVLYLGQAALGLDRAHLAGIVHRDLKPENLFLTRRDDGSPCVKVLDFGIAKIVARRTRATDTRTMGTPTFMAPEQIRGEGTIGPRADVYALGHIAYTLLVGEEYWREEARRARSMFAFFSRVVEGMVEAPSVRALRTHGVVLSPAFDRWLARAAAGAPEARFASAGGAIAELAAALDVATPPGVASDTLVSTPRPGASALATDVGGGATIVETASNGGPAGEPPRATDTAPMSAWSQATLAPTRVPATQPLTRPSTVDAEELRAAAALPRRGLGLVRAPFLAIGALVAAAAALAIVVARDRPVAGPAASGSSTSPVEPSAAVDAGAQAAAASRPTPAPGASAVDRPVASSSGSAKVVPKAPTPRRPDPLPDGPGVL